MAEKMNKFIRAVVNHPEYDALVGSTGMFNIYAKDYPSGLPVPVPGARNGHGDIGRADSALCQKYIIRKFTAGGTVYEWFEGVWKEVALDFDEEPYVPSDAKGSTVVAWRSVRHNTVFRNKPKIPLDWKKDILSENCVFSGTEAQEVDHKFGRQYQGVYPSTVEKEHFQPVSKIDNIRKRSNCKKCQETGRRFDARSIPGFKKGWVQGGEKFEHNGIGCVGCYLFDPVAYRKAVQK